MKNNNTPRADKAPVPDAAACGYYLRIFSERTAPDQMIADIAILRRMIDEHRDWLPEQVHTGMIYHCADLMLRLAAHRPPDEPSFMAKYGAFEQLLTFQASGSNLKTMVSVALAADARAIAPHLLGATSKPAQ